MPVPRVTIGMPVFNRAHLVAETIGYVLAQTFIDFELIIFNDGSKDETADVVRGIKDPRVRFMDSENLGPPHPLNRLYDAASGELIVILHDHDIFDPTLIAKSVAALDSQPCAGFVLQGCATVSEDGGNFRNQVRDWPPLNSGRAAGEAILLSTAGFASPFHACSMIRRSALESVGMHYDPSLGLYSDGDLWLRLLARYDFAYIPEVLFQFREREQGHFLSNREFHILDVMRRIYLRNGEAFFAGDPIKMSLFVDRLRKNFGKAERHLALRAFIKRTPCLKVGLRRVAANPQHSIVARLAARAGLALTSAEPQEI